jgi:hypothetical protein
VTTTEIPQLHPTIAALCGTWIDAEPDVDRNGFYGVDIRTTEGAKVRLYANEPEGPIYVCGMTRSGVVTWDARFSENISIPVLSAFMAEALAS